MRRTRTFVPMRRPRPHWEWNRAVVNNATPNATLNNEDLLATLKTKMGIAINLPEIVIWRVHIKISIVFTLAATAKANDGVLATIFVDDTTQVLLNQSANPLSEHDMLFYEFYANDQLLGTQTTGAATYFVVKEFDVKAHRKLDALDNTLWLQLASTGAAQMTSYSYATSTLLKLGRG